MKKIVKENGEIFEIEYNLNYGVWDVRRKYLGKDEDIPKVEKKKTKKESKD